MTRRKLERPNHMTPAERDEAVRLYRAGQVTRDDLAEKYGRGRRTIDNLLKRKQARKSDHEMLSV